MAEATDEGQPRFVAPPVAGIPYRFVALAIVCLGIFLGTLDTSIINIALPTLAAEFDVSSGDVIWVSLIFILVSTGLGLAMGRLGDLYGRKQLYIVGFALFTAAAGAAAIAGSLPELLGARVIQAVGASMVLANGAAIITATFPVSQRGMGLGIMVATVGAGVATGPVLGGVLVDVLDWRAIFWVRIPFGLVGSLLVAKFLVDARPDQRPRGLDLTGSLTLFLMLGGAVLAVNRGDAWGWDSAKIIGLFALSAVLSVLFVWIERRSTGPVVDLGLFRQRAFSGGVVSAIFQFFGLSAVIILMPFYLVEARGFSTLEAGAIMAAFPIAMLVVSPVSGLLSDRVSAPLLTTVGLLVVTGGLVFSATLTAETSIVGIVARLFIVGTGTAIFSTPNTSAIMSAVPPDRLGTASAAQTTARTIGNAIGIAVAGAILTSEVASFAARDSVLGLDDPDSAAAGIVSGVRLALAVAAAMAALAIPPALLRGPPPAIPVAPDPEIAEAAPTD